MPGPARAGDHRSTPGHSDDAGLREARWLHKRGLMGTIDRIVAGCRIGDYVIEREDGDGYVATHVLLPRRVRLSVMHPTFVGLRPVAVRMMREACILEALRHPGVPRVYEVGVLADQRTQRPWIASELVEGESLAETMLLGGYISVVELLAVLRETGEVLAYAHARNVAHRGVRPDAIVRGDGSRGFPLCLVNWGEARVPDASEDTDRAFADDVFALGLVADLVLATRTGVMRKVLALVEDMLAPNPMSRPTAAEVASRAKAMLDALEAPVEPIDDVIEEKVVLVDISRPRPTPPPIPVARPRLRWTPALGVESPPPAAAAYTPLARIKR